MIDKYGEDFQREAVRLALSSGLLNFGEYSLLDGRALLLALRPLSVENRPYRFGATKFSYLSIFEVPSYLSTGRYEGDGTWIVDRADDLRFSFLAVGSWEVTHNENANEPSVKLGFTEQLLYDSVELNILIHDSFKAFEERWGDTTIEAYSVFLTPPVLDAENFGQYSGIANPQSAAIHQGLGAHPRDLMTAIVHEIAHHWIPSRLGFVVDDTWIGEGLVELTTYIELVRLGYTEEEFLVSRINRAISNLQSTETVLQLVYDLGIASWLIATESSNADLLENRFDFLIEELRVDSDQQLTAERFWSHSELPISESNYENVDVLFSHLPCRINVNAIEYSLVEQAGLLIGDRIGQIDSFGFGDIHNPLTIQYNRDGEFGSVTYIPKADAGSEVYLQYVSSVDAGNYGESSRCKAF